MSLFFAYYNIIKKNSYQFRNFGWSVSTSSLILDLISVYLKESKGSKSELKMLQLGNFTVISEFWCIIFRTYLHVGRNQLFIFNLLYITSQSVLYNPTGVCPSLMFISLCVFSHTPSHGQFMPPIIRSSPLPPYLTRPLSFTPR